MSEASNERTKISASFLITLYLLNFNGTAQNVTKSNPFRQRSHGGGNCSDDGGAHEGEPALHPTPSKSKYYPKEIIMNVYVLKDQTVG